MKKDRIEKGRRQKGKGEICDDTVKGTLHLRIRE
jgi:hypothetical protein